MRQYEKSQSSVLDYGFLWYDWLDGKTIEDSTWTSSSPELTIVNSVFTDKITAVTISGGLPNKRYKLVNTITTSGATPLVDSRPISILILPAA